MFGASTPETFFADILARQPDPATGLPDPRKVQAFREAHPDSLPQFEFLKQHNPPPAWTNSSYFGVHTFKFVNRSGAVTLARWRFAPHDGDQEFTSAELQSLPPKFLEKRLVERIGRGPAQWDMILTIGEPGDSENDPTKLWPSTRKELKVGTLSISSVAPQENAACHAVNFDPLVLSDGIQPTNDPVLLARSAAYAISFGKRTAGK
jgi:catalase